MEQFINLTWATLASGMDAVQTTMYLTPGHGARFGTIAPGNKIRIVLLDALKNVSEVMYITGISGDTANVLRGQDGTTATTHLAVDRLEARIGKSSMDTMRQPVHIQQGSETLLGSVSGVDNITAAATPTLTAQMSTGSLWKLPAAGANTGAAATINVDGQGPVILLRPDGTALQANDIPAANYPCLIEKRAADAILMNPANLIAQRIAQADARYAPLSVFLVKGFFYQTGWQMSAPGSSGTMTITPGVAADSSNAALISTASIYTKGTGAWAVGSGNGGLDTGTIAANTWYYWYAIRRPDTSVCDFCFSASAVAPTLPAAYTQYVQIGFMLTDGASTWTAFKQVGRDFWYLTPQLAFYNTASSTTPATVTLVAAGSGKVLMHLNAGCQFSYYISDPDTVDMAPSITAAPGTSTGAGSQGEVNVWSNASGQVRYRAGGNSGGQFIVVKGWTVPA